MNKYEVVENPKDIFPAPPQIAVKVCNEESLPYSPLLIQPEGAWCIKCGVFYPLPKGAKTFRCKSCNHFNSTQNNVFNFCNIL